MSRIVSVVLLLVASVLSALSLPGVVVGAAGAPAAEARTWVVDAIDDTSSNRWESVDTGTTVVTIAVGDTVEWQFDRATMGHDLVSLPASGPFDGEWDIEEYREPGDGKGSVTHTFTEPGTYSYECSLHSGVMTGTVVVVPAGDNQSPTTDAVVEPRTGAAPLVVHASANADDPDGDVPTVSWDFGAGGAVSYTDHAVHEYRTPGTYVVRLRVSDSRGGLTAEDFTITVTGGSGPTDPGPPTEDPLPEVEALVAPGQGTAPLAVAFSSQVTTRGAVHSYSAGLDDHPALTGEAVMVRSRGRTTTTLEVSGTKPSATHSAVHVHERACSDELGGAHFRFDTGQPFAEPNEIWPLFTSDAAGSSGLVEVVKPMRAGPDAVSVVVHDPDNAARRIGCADLAPSTAGLTYSWDLGDGTAATGPDPDHTYAAPGTYTATVTVTRGSGAHPHARVSDSVQVVVGGATTPDPMPSPTPVTPPTVTPVPTPTVDRTPPRVSRMAPRRAIRDATPTVRARVRDRDSRVRRKHVVLRVDGRRTTGVRYAARRGLVRWTPRRRLAPGRHVVRLVVRDVAGNRVIRTWRFRVVRPR